jgi:hypothetical protein
VGAASAGAAAPATNWTDALLACTPGEGPDPCRWFIGTYCLTLDENGHVEPIPVNWPYVAEYVWALQSGDDLHVEKSRQMMATWISCAYFLWAVMFRDGFAGFLASRKQALVDDGGENSTPNSLMGRIRFIYDRLPEHFKREIPVRFSHLRIDCLRRHSFVVGEAANGEIGRGGTYTQALVDEAAMLERSEASHRSIRLACQRGLVYQSTPNGRGNVFADIKFENPGSFRFLSMHWTRHPVRSRGKRQDPATGRWRSAWYDQLAANMTDDSRARELDISYEHSVSGLVWPQFDLRWPGGAHMDDALAYNPFLSPLTGLDFGIGAATAGALGQVHINDRGLGELHVLDDYEVQNQPVEVHARSIEGKWRALGFAGPRAKVRMFGDPAGNAREMVKGSTVVWAYQREGFSDFFTPSHPLRDGLGLVARLAHQGRIKIHPRCAVLRKRIPDYRYPTDDMGRVMGDEPVKTGTAAAATHAPDGLRYLVTSVFPIHEIGNAMGIATIPSRHDRPAPVHERPIHRNGMRGVMSGRREF